MKKIILIFLIISSLLFSKDYSTGIGARGGFSLGVTAKHFISDDTALEAVLSSRWRGIQIDGLWEKHNWDFNVDELSWYYGGGVYIAFFDDSNEHPWREDQDVDGLLGLNGLAGMEYAFPKYPFCISVDWKPYLNFIGGLRFIGDEFSLSIRYTF